MNDNTNTNIWLIIIGALVLGAIFSAGTVSNTVSTPASFDPDRGSAEYRYAKERVKLEGYSDKEAAQAADAIIKFHNAQKARGQ